MTSTAVARQAQWRPPGFGRGVAFGTFGELMQGVTPKGNFLVTLPIARWSTATVMLTARPDHVAIEPEYKSKSQRLIAVMLTRYGWHGGASGVISSELPEGKGMASSSADLVATARATAEALGVSLVPGDIEDLLRDIEPTDGVMHRGIVAFDHRGVRLRQVLGCLPTMTIIGVDEGGTVDTVAFNRLPKPFTPADRLQYARMLRLLGAAVRRQDLPAVGQLTTRSALMNQRFQRKAMLDTMIDICREAGGLGVVAAHSGTALGILLAVDDPDHNAKLRVAVDACTGMADKVTVHRTLSFDTADEV